eukprot:UN2103
MQRGGWRAADRYGDSEGRSVHALLHRVKTEACTMLAWHGAPRRLRSTDNSSHRLERCEGCLGKRQESSCTSQSRGGAWVLVLLTTPCPPATCHCRSELPSPA